VEFDGVFADLQFMSNGPVGQPFGHLLQHFQFTGSEGFCQGGEWVDGGLDGGDQAGVDHHYPLMGSVEGGGQHAGICLSPEHPRHPATPNSRQPLLIRNQHHQRQTGACQFA